MDEFCDKAGEVWKVVFGIIFWVAVGGMLLPAIGVGIFFLGFLTAPFIAIWLVCEAASRAKRLVTQRPTLTEAVLLPAPTSRRSTLAQTPGPTPSGIPGIWS
jgi:hypothetical protein